MAVGETSSRRAHMKGLSILVSFLIIMTFLGIVQLFHIPESSAATVTLQWSYKTAGDVNGVAMSSDGSYVAAGSSDSYVYFFDRDGNCSGITRLAALFSMWRLSLCRLTPCSLPCSHQHRGNPYGTALPRRATEKFANVRDE